MDNDGTDFQGYIGAKIGQEWLRMYPMDVSDVYYNAFLLNGQKEKSLPRVAVPDNDLWLRGPPALTSIPVRVSSRHFPPAFPLSFDRHDNSSFRQSLRLSRQSQRNP